MDGIKFIINADAHVYTAADRREDEIREQYASFDKTAELDNVQFLLSRIDELRVKLAAAPE